MTIETFYFKCSLVFSRFNVDPLFFFERYNTVNSVGFSTSDLTIASHVSTSEVDPFVSTMTASTRLPIKIVGSFSGDSCVVTQAL